MSYCRKESVVGNSHSAMVGATHVAILGLAQNLVGDW